MLKVLAATAALAALPAAAFAGDCSSKATTASSEAVYQTQVLAAGANDAKVHTVGYGSGKTYAAKADIVDTAINAGGFDTLVAAVQAAGLVDTLKSDGPFTVFAPTDAAFAALPEGTVDTLLLPENRDQLAAVLTYHVVPGKVMAADLTDGLTADTVNGSSVAFDLSQGAKIGNAPALGISAPRRAAPGQSRPQRVLSPAPAPRPCRRHGHGRDAELRYRAA